MKSSRRRARELVLQGLYQRRVTAGDPGVIRLQLQEAPAFSRADATYFGELWEGIAADPGQLEQMLSPHVARKLADLSPVEHSILLIGAYELSRRPEIPFRIVLNEAIELAKSYGGSEGHKFVNGVLDKLVPLLRGGEVTRTPA